MTTNKRIAVASCNGGGKSHLAARAAIWFLKTFRPSIVVTTAPTDRQVRRILWKEIHTAYQRAALRGHILGPKPLQKEWDLGPDHFALGFSTRDYTTSAFQGLHSENMLVIADEGAGLSESTWEGIFSISKGENARILTIGNPTSLDGRFFEAFQSTRWWTTNISAFDTPNLQGRGIVIPGLVTEDDVENARQDWGEGSPLWIARVEGRFPQTMEDVLIAIHLVEQAGTGPWEQEDMDLVDPAAPVEVGADFARYGTDRNVFVARRGRLGLEMESFGAESLGKTGVMTAAGRLWNFAKRTGARRIKCDAVGLGGGVPDRLRELQLTGTIPRDIDIVDLNAGASPRDKEKYADQGTEMWAALADRLKQDRAMGPIFQDRRTLAELTRRKYRILSDGRMKLEPKDEMKKRGLKSPDHGDAIAMAFYEAPPRKRPGIRAISVG